MTCHECRKRGGTSPASNPAAVLAAAAALVGAGEGAARLRLFVYEVDSVCIVSLVNEGYAYIYDRPSLQYMPCIAITYTHTCASSSLNEMRLCAAFPASSTRARASSLSHSSGDRLTRREGGSSLCVGVCVCACMYTCVCMSIGWGVFVREQPTCLLCKGHSVFHTRRGGGTNAAVILLPLFM